MSGTRGASSESDGSDPPPVQNTDSEHRFRTPDQSPRIRAPGSEPPDQNLPVQISSISVHFLAASASS